MPSDENYKKHKDIYNNYATPLMGTFLNLPYQSTEITCPSCNIKDMTEVRKEMRSYAFALNLLYCTLFYCFCCRCCFDFDYATTKHDVNHYCQHCDCFLGHAKRRMPLQYEKGKKITNIYGHDVYSMS